MEFNFCYPVSRANFKCCVVVIDTKHVGPSQIKKLSTFPSDQFTRLLHVIKLALWQIDRHGLPRMTSAYVHRITDVTVRHYFDFWQQHSNKHTQYRNRL